MPKLNLDTINKMNPKLKAILMVGILLAVVVVAALVYINFFQEQPTFSVHSNQVRRPQGPLMLKIDQTQQQQVESAVCMVPIATTPEGNDVFEPILFNTTDTIPQSISSIFPTTPLALSTFGNDRSSISISIAEKNWYTIGTPILVSNYSNALLAMPLACNIFAPIIFNGPKVQRFLDDNAVQSLIIIGDCPNHDLPFVKLDGREAVWEYYLTFNPNPDYIIVTNPYDTDFSNKDIYIHGMSVTSAALGGRHGALVICDNFTVPYNYTTSLGFGTSAAGTGERGGEPPAFNETEKLRMQTAIDYEAIKIDNAIDNAYQFIFEHTGIAPKYVALVGDDTTVPMLYAKSPIWFEGVNQDEKGEEFVASDQWYGDIDVKIGLGAGDANLENNFNHISDQLYTQEMAVGRIVGADILDASALVARSLGYWQYGYDANVLNLLGNKAWPHRAWILNSLMTGTSDTGAGRHQQAMFVSNKMAAELWTPKEMYLDQYAPVPGDVATAVQHMQDVDAAIYDGHGYPDGWYHMWTHTGDDNANYDRVGYEDVRILDLHTIPVFGACCLSSALDWPAVWTTSTGGGTVMTPENCFSLAVIRGGALCYIGATEESWGAFFGGLKDGDPDSWGYGDFDMPTMVWQNLLEENKDIGTSLKDAKVTFYSEEWGSFTSRPFARICLLETQLYGDPEAPYGAPGQTS